MYLSEFVTVFCNTVLSVVLFSYAEYQGCSSNQSSTVTVTAATGDYQRLRENDSMWLPSNLSCQWNITAPVGMVVRIKVQAFFGACSDDHLRIHDGPSNSSDIIVQYCDGVSAFQSYFFSSGRNMFLETKTGQTDNQRMRVYYHAVDFQNCSKNSTLDAPQSPAESNFTSPYYPLGFPLNTTCRWYITAPENHTVKLQLTSLLSGWYFSKDSVEVFDVDGSQLSVNSLRLNNPLPHTHTIFSKFRSLYILFTSDGKPQKSGSSEQGIAVSYTAVKPGRSCSLSNSEDQNMNIILKDPSGIIKTPEYPSNFPKDLTAQCVWKIIAPKGQVVRVDFSSFRMGKSHCVYIYDSINKENPVETVKCRYRPSFTVYSTGTELSLKVKYIWGEKTTGPGFIANYSTPPAGISSGTCIVADNSTVHMSGEGRSFTTPGFPKNPGIGTCGWNITVPAGNYIKLTFLEFAESCKQNYAEVFDVTNSTSEILTGRLCDKKVVFSKGNNVLVKFSVEKVAQYRGGFLASYEAVNAVPSKYSCSYRGYVSNLKATKGEFASFDYPQSYPNDAKCAWTLTVPMEYLIQLTFHSFDLQQSEDCQADYVEIKSGKYKHDSQVIGRFCGSSLPASFQSNYSKVYVDFMTDSSGRYPGFHASFKAVPNPAMGPCKNQGIDNVIPLTAETGRLFSPLYPQTYPPNVTCTWIITVPEGRFVRLKITSFHLGYICRGSTLKIRDGDTSSSDLLKSFCGGTFESSVFSSGRHLWIRFQTPDGFLYGTGFNALFEAVNQLPAPFSCTSSNRINKLKSESGTLASYNYPLPYDDNVECTWVIYVDTDYKIKLSFDFFNLSRSSDCSDDYVEVRDGQFSTSDLLGKFCGSEKPESITSDLWDLHVKFKSSGKTKYPGFKASYETKNSTTAILKIVGIVLGAVSALCILIGGCCKYHSRSNNVCNGAAVVQGSPEINLSPGFDAVAPQEQLATTKM